MTKINDADRTGDLVIIRNSAKCGMCHVEVVSRDVHDFVRCPCGNIYVDGGKHYLRRGWKDGEFFEDTSITIDRSKE
jgi:uncharacterized C2H2 Zn-finger protein